MTRRFGAGAPPVVRVLVGAGLLLAAVTVAGALGGPGHGSLAAAQPVRSAGAAAASRVANPHGGFGLHVVAPTRAAAGSVVAVRVAAHAAPSEEETRPLPGADLRVELLDLHGVVVARAAGRSDAHGLADLRLRLPDRAPGRLTLRVEGSSPLGRQRREGHLEITTGGRLLLTSDKPLYQPGQTIYYRALALRPIDLKPLAGRALVFEVEDPRGNLVARQEAKTSPFGVAAGQLRLAAEVTLGTYKLRAVIRSAAGLAEVRDERTVKVARYAPPKFKITITPDRPYERPGARATGVVAARYFFGKPVAGARLWLDAGAYAVTATTGADGTYRYQVPVHRSGPLVLSVRVRDGAAQEESAARSVPVEAAPFRVELIAEGHDLVPGLENLVYVTAVRPDGAPVVGATVLGAGRTVRTDAAGVAALPFTPSPRERWRAGFAVTVTARTGERVRTNARLPVARSWSNNPALLLRPTRVLVPRGAPVGAEVVSTLRTGMAYLDVVKNGQTLRAAAAPLVGGRAHFALPADDATFGTLTLHAQVVDGAGRRGAAERVVYAERRAALRLEVTPDRAVYAPGDHAVLSFRTVDATSGAGAAAQIGVVMVDDAVLALAPLRPGLERVYFTLAREAEHPRYALRYGPAGYTVQRAVSASGQDALRERVARVLLAGAVAPGVGWWETDPWRERRDAWRRQAPRLARAVERFMERHSAGVRINGRWQFRDDLFPALAAAGTVPDAEIRDPWQRVVTPTALTRAWSSFRFPEYADRVARAKLRRAYAKLTAGARSLVREPLRGRPASKRPYVFDLEAARRLCDAHDLVDPWGHELRVLRGTRYLYPYYGEFLSRFVLTSAGPDGLFGTDDDVQPPGDEYLPPSPGQKLVSARHGVLRVITGHGYGGGGAGFGGLGFGRRGGGAAIHVARGVVMGSIGQERIRQSFPETMLWKPDLVTDAAGRARLEVEMADSITTWRLLAVATAADGRIGTAELGVRVFQDFFVDVDLPARLTVGDEVAVPVAVYNYQKQPSHVLLHLDDGPWFTRLSEADQAIDLAPGQTGVRYFRIRAARVGAHALTVHARGGALTDAVRRQTEIAPDGVAVERSISDRLAQPVTHEVTVPADALADTPRLAVRVFPGPMSQTVDGLEGLIRMPSGCFEQTSSTTYPNALILDYLRRSRTGTAAIRRRAEEYLALGYQRLLSFEVPGGGFSWFGRAPANQVLTAYGLNEFADIARVRFVDRKVIERTTRWLVGRQRPDGGFDPDRENIFDGAVNAMAGDRLRTTAYVALGLARSGYRGPALRKAVAFVKRHVGALKDPYALALAADLFATVGEAEAGRLLGRVWSGHHREAKGVSFAPAQPTLTHGGGRTGRIETTAIVAEAHYAARRDPLRARAALDYLIASKDVFGSWSSTQATVMTLRALLAAAASQGSPRGTVAVTVDGVAVASVTLDERSGDVTHEVDLQRYARPGAHRVGLAFSGRGQPMYQIVTRSYRPRAAVAPPAPGALRLAVSYDRTAVRRHERLTARVKLEATGARSIAMPVAEIGVPPGFEVDEEALERLVRSRRVDKYGRGAGTVVLYLSALRPGAPVELALPLRARMPARVQAPPSVVYEYYQPESRAEVAPVVLTVRG